MEDDRKRADDEILQEEYWDRVFLRMFLRVGVFAFAVTVVGVLATPVVMSLMYTWLWMLLYPVYLVVILMVIADRKRR